MQGHATSNIVPCSNTLWMHLSRYLRGEHGVVGPETKHECLASGPTCLLPLTLFVEGIIARIIPSRTRTSVWIFSRDSTLRCRSPCTELERIPRRHMACEVLSMLWEVRVRLLTTVRWMRIWVDLRCLLRQYPSLLVPLHLYWWCHALWHPLNLMPLHHALGLVCRVNRLLLPAMLWHVRWNNIRRLVGSMLRLRMSVEGAGWSVNLVHIRTPVFASIRAACAPAT